MTQKAKLKKVIEKAVENGWIHVSVNEEYQAILFDKSFAKAIWGECTHEGAEFEKEMLGEEWQHHLQQAVISKNPIDYYYENMEGI